MKRWLQWNTLILSTGPTSCRNLHCSVICPLKAPGNPDALEFKSCKPRFFQEAVKLCNWLHFPQETGIHVENKASHRDILCAGYLMSGPTRVNASRTGGRCSPSPSRPYGTRARSLRGFGIGRELVRCNFIVEYRVSPPALFGNLLLSFSLTKAWVKTPGTSTTKGASVLFFGFHWSFTIMEPSAKGRPLLGTPALYAAIMVGLATITLSTSSIRAEETTAQSSYPLKSENAIALGDFSEYFSCA